MGVYGCVTDACECIRMHTDAYGSILNRVLDINYIALAIGPFLDLRY